MPIDEQTYKDIMSLHPGGVTVVTTIDESGRALGLTVSAITTVSLHPPRILIVIDKKSHTVPALLESGAFTVSLLAAGTEDMAMYFASKEPDKFSDLPEEAYEALPTGPALVADSTAYLECRTTQAVDSGDHWILVGGVERGRVLAQQEPLVYWHRDFRELDVD
jgi:flavin reductase (DIM6/NTAB) family NADH-FMN oxidoreductase RutF